MNASEAIFHLALLGMYADNNLAETEDTRISKLLTDLGMPDDTGLRGAFISQAFTRVRSVGHSDEATAEFLTKELKPALAGLGEKERALATLTEILGADGATTAGEQNLMGLAKWLL